MGSHPSETEATKFSYVLIGAFPPGVEHVKLVQVGGDPGSETETCSFTYDAFLLGSNQKLEGSPFVLEPEFSNRQANLELTAATLGHIWDDAGTLKLISANEVEYFEDCENANANTGDNDMDPGTAGL